jgi:hypothetical protein
MSMLTPRPVLAIAAAMGSALALCACKPAIEPPAQAGLCSHLAAIENGKPRFNTVAQNVPDLEHCAAHLEAMRQRFISLGSNNTSIVGAYQSQFLFLDDTGVSTAQTYDGARYPFLVRSGDQLVPVGSQ